jgi:4-hydroxymandelate oxidase
MLGAGFEPEGVVMSALSVSDYEPLARAKVRDDYWDYVMGGSGAERTLAANRAGFDRVLLRPRVLVDVATCDTTTSVLGIGLSAPIAVAPMAFHRIMHPDGEVATARGAADAGSLFVTSFFSSRSFADIAASAGTAPRWLQLYWIRDRELFGVVVDLAVKFGYSALVLTVDAPVLGLRFRDLRNGFALDPDIRAANLDEAITGGLHDHHGGRSALADNAVQVFDASVTWADLAWLRERCPLPILVKGVLTAEDATLAVAHGVDGIVVSNHGGRQLDNAISGIEALPEVVEAVAGRCPVIVDGGVRTGTDVFAALALGAAAVLIGRPVLWGLAADGATGARHVLDLLRAELAHTMALAGRPTIADIDRSAVRIRTG